MVVFHDPPRERSRLMVQIESDNRVIIAKVSVRVGPDGIVQRLMPADRLQLWRIEESLRQFSVCAPPFPTMVAAVMIVAVARRPMMLDVHRYRAVKSLRQWKAPSPMLGLSHLPVVTAWNPIRAPVGRNRRRIHREGGSVKRAGVHYPGRRLHFLDGEIGQPPLGPGVGLVVMVDRMGGAGNRQHGGSQASKSFFISPLSARNLPQAAPRNLTKTAASNASLSIFRCCWRGATHLATVPPQFDEESARSPGCGLLAAFRTFCSD